MPQPNDQRPQSYAPEPWVKVLRIEPVSHQQRTTINRRLAQKFRTATEGRKPRDERASGKAKFACVSNAKSTICESDQWSMGLRDNLVRA
jgi:hypothetical protein